MSIDPFVLKMQLRKALSLIKGLRRHISDADEDVIVLKLLEELDVAGFEIVKKPGSAGFTFDTPGGDGRSDDPIHAERTSLIGLAAGR
jgi:hypothetical protein